MSLKDQFTRALNAQATHESLLKLVEKYQQQGLTPDESYKVLEQIWLQLGFNGTDEQSPERDNLEYVMEKVWYQGAH